MPASFIIEFYEPGIAKSVWMEWKSNSPFMAISVGDIIHTREWPQEKVAAKAVFVSKVEHEFWGSYEEPTHKLKLHTGKIA